DALLQQSWPLLSPDEQLASGRFHFERDRARYVLTRALIRTALSRYVGIRPQDWRFERDDYGRPHVIAEQRSADLPAFNLSHTRGLIACAITDAAHIGVDVERTGRSRSLEIAERYFAPAEVRALRSAPLERQSEAFYCFWTLKESYIKARGM